MTPAADPVAAPRPGTPALRLTHAAQDHLKAIWAAGEWVEQPVTTTMLAERLELSPSTVSEQVRRLVELGLVLHEPYRPVALTPAGQAQALRVVRRHRLLETYLVAELGYTWDEVHAEAETLEHAVSDLMLERIDVLLGHPASDPHGDPIPAADGTLVRPAAVPLAELAEGEDAEVARVDDRDPALLRWCDRAGLRPGAAVRLRRRTPEGDGDQRGATVAELLAAEVTLAPAVLAAVRVVRAPAEGMVRAPTEGVAAGRAAAPGGRTPTGRA